MGNDKLEDLILIVIGKCIELFKTFQIKFYKENNINDIIVTTKNNCCPACKTLSTTVKTIDKINHIHPFCDINIIPITDCKVNIINEYYEIYNCPEHLTDILNRLFIKLKTQFKDLITFKAFEFKDDINMVYEQENKVFIPNELIKQINIESIILRFILKDKLYEKADDSWRNIYKIKKDSKNVGDKCIVYSLPFINTLAQDNVKEYVLQCYITYLLDIDLLRSIDITAYNKIIEE